MPYRARPACPTGRRQLYALQGETCVPYRARPACPTGRDLHALQGETVDNEKLGSFDGYSASTPTNTGKLTPSLRPKYLEKYVGGYAARVRSKTSSIYAEAQKM